MVNLYLRVLMSLIVALDPPVNVDEKKWCVNLIDEIGDVVHGLKFGLPLIIKVGVKGLKDILSTVNQRSKLLIADLKLADIGYVMALIVKTITDTGVNTVIAHAFVGVKGALEELSEVCRELNINLVLVARMSHPGASDVMDKVFDDLLRIVKMVNAWGAVLPATRPDIIKTGRKFLGPSIKILSPGVGAQGAKPGEALCVGADYEIVGRLITRSKDPLGTALKVINEQRERLRSCRGS